MVRFSGVILAPAEWHVPYDKIIGCASLVRCGQPRTEKSAASATRYEINLQLVRSQIASDDDIRWASFCTVAWILEVDLALFQVAALIGQSTSLWSEIMTSCQCPDPGLTRGQCRFQVQVFLNYIYILYILVYFIFYDTWQMSRCACVCFIAP